MIPRRFKWVWQTSEDVTAIVLDLRSFPVKQPRREHNFPAKHFANALMSETNSEQRNFLAKASNDFLAQACVSRPSRSRRNADVCGPQPGNFVERNLVITFNDQSAPELAKILDEIVSK